jgi:hypothetical protein
MLSDVMISVVMLIAIMPSFYAECHYNKCIYGEWLGTVNKLDRLFSCVVFMQRPSVTFAFYEENVVTSFKSNLLLMIFWLHIINYNS